MRYSLLLGRCSRGSARVTPAFVPGWNKVNPRRSSDGRGAAHSRGRSSGKTTQLQNSRRSSCKDGRGSVFFLNKKKKRLGRVKKKSNKSELKSKSFSAACLCRGSSSESPGSYLLLRVNVRSRYAASLARRQRYALSSSAGLFSTEWMGTQG